MVDQPESPLKLLWQSQYPFEYWSNRLEKINPYNQADRLEALYSIVQLSDVYLHIFVAYAQNPHMPWFILKEKTRKWHIDDVLGELQTDELITVGNLIEETDHTIKVEPLDEFDLSDMDSVAAGVLGCPYEVDEDTMSVTFDESPDLHRAIANAILNFAEEHRPLLNDFKHGFRVLPVTPDELEAWFQSSVMLDETDYEEYKQDIQNLREKHNNDEWGFSFVRIEPDDDPEYGYDFQMDLYHVDAWTCYKFAELTLDALYNLIHSGSGRSLEESVLNMPTEVIEENESFMDHVFGFVTPIADDPDAEIPYEEFF